MVAFHNMQVDARELEERIVDEFAVCERNYDSEGNDFEDCSPVRFVKSRITLANKRFEAPPFL
jgi:hypothetical protein